MLESGCVRENRGDSERARENRAEDFIESIDFEVPSEKPTESWCW